MFVELKQNIGLIHSRINPATRRFEIVDLGRFSLTEPLAIVGGSVVEVADEFAEELLEYGVGVAVEMSAAEFHEQQVRAECEAGTVHRAELGAAA